MNKEERAKINNEVIKALNKLKVNYRLTDNQSSQFNVYINDSLIVYYAVKKTLYYKENRKNHTNPFYDENYENQEIEDLVKFIEKEKKKIDYIRTAEGYTIKIDTPSVQSKLHQENSLIIWEEKKIIEPFKKPNDYISKDKIREKIKELEQYQEEHKKGNWCSIPIEDYDFDKINLLKELLGEEG